MLTSPTSPTVANSPPMPVPHAFGTGDLVEVFTDSVRALARVRESSASGRLHIAFEMGEYLPWVDAAVLIRHVATSDMLSARPSCTACTACTAHILHAGTSTALLQIVAPVEELAPVRQPYDTIPSLDE